MAITHPPTPDEHDAEHDAGDRALEATYRDGALWPETPLDLPAGARVRLRLLETVAPPDSVAPPAAAAFHGYGLAAGLVAGGLAAAGLAELAVGRGLVSAGIIGYLAAAALVAAGARAPVLAAA
ncbi:MAG: hypothetical protein HGA45_35760, partial [Chloroflexales bacterium]|nr:hypothetical protein [Chloroflexales bacterium]